MSSTCTSVHTSTLHSTHPFFGSSLTHSQWEHTSLQEAAKSTTCPELVVTGATVCSTHTFHLILLRALHTASKLPSD
jgi:hypothetical protein